MNKTEVMIETVKNYIDFISLSIKFTDNVLKCKIVEKIYLWIFEVDWKLQCVQIKRFGKVCNYITYVTERMN